jgi:PAS domain S-box-containing protein
MAHEPDEPLEPATASGLTADAATVEGLSVAWRQVNEALRDSERRYRELVEYSLGLICTHGLDGTILSINPAAAHSLGYTPHDGVGRNLRDFLAPEKRDLFDGYLHRIREKGRDEGLMSVQARTGEIRVWFYRNVLSQAPDGSFHVLGHAVDVTERIEAERTLRHNEQMLRTAQAELEERVKERTRALETANDRLRVEIAERQAAERSRERALIEQRDTLAFLAAFSERLAPVVAFEELLDVVCEKAVPFLADTAVAHSVQDDGSIRLAGGAPVGAERAPATMPSPAVARVIASGKVAILAGDELVTEPILPGGALPAVAAAIVPLSMDGRVKGVISLLSADERRFTGSGSLVLDDVVRRTRLALDRIQLYREAQEANRLKDEFLSTLSHELRTPLNAIYGWARILRNRRLDESTSHAVEVIQRNAEAQVRLIDEVLDVSRIITGKMALATDVLDVAGIVAASIDIVRPALQAKRIRFEERIAAVPPVVGDGHRLQQAFWNVLSNALKFTGSDGAITVLLRSDAGRVEFEVSDTGVGIRREVLPFVFDRFRQADSSMSRSYGGLGLGLAIVRHVVELHGGSVRAASAGEGQGATFTIQLPVAPADVRRAATTTAPPRPTKPLRLKGRTILVVEDHADARELIAAVLENAGARVEAASSATDAIDIGRHLHADVLVTDLGLPGEDGYALLTRFRAQHPGVPAIALTAYARSTDRERALAHGFQRYLIKPIDPDELVEEIASVF